ncbi:MAG: S8 family serine peptidase [Catenulispora sp.]|nr:S8 family serine peptidase [Catenulispora sp.]
MPTAGAVTAGTAAQDAAPAASGTSTASGPLLSYVVNTRANHGQVMKAEREIVANGGTVLIAYEEVGVIVARSTDPAFAAKMRALKGIDSAGASRTAAIAAEGDPVDVVSPDSAAADPAALQANQWDMKAIGADRAHAVSEGSRSVVVGVLDSGIDATHPNLAPNIDAADSVGCTNGGVPDTSFAAWQPTTSGHGTHVAGTIAAADNNTGVIGVAPNVRLAAVKVVDDAGFIYPEYAVCGFVWAGHHHFKVTNNSYFVDPWLYNCPDDPDQAAIVDAVKRAVTFATNNGVLSFAAAGNENQDLANKTVDTTSPDDTTPVSRPVTTSCLNVPAELPGVVTVSATGSLNARSYYSSFGQGKVEVAAPGGDRKFQIPDTPDQNGRVLSTLPGGTWGYLQGTSMASPHATGVGALLASTHPYASPAQLRALLDAQADPLACPVVEPDPGGSTCTGTAGNDSFYGHGLVDAYDAVTK